MADPTTAPSATSHTSAAWAGVLTPTPTSTGRSVTALRRAAVRVALAASSARIPVMPIRPTPYTKPRERAQMRGSRSSGAVGAASSTVSTPAASAHPAHSPTSSRGRSGRMQPLMPAAASDEANRSYPMWWAMFT